MTNEDLLHTSQELINIREFKKVIELLDDETLSKLNSVELYTERARAFVKMSQIEKSLADFDHAIAINPEYPIIYSSRSEVWYKQRRYDKL